LTIVLPVAKATEFKPPALEGFNLHDERDADGYGKTDCADRKDCGKDPVCTGGGGDPGGDAEVCNDGIDNDGDGKTDCSDKRDCRTDPACQ
jgi:hypothetical protein